MVFRCYFSLQREKRVKMSTLLLQRWLFSQLLDYSLNSHSFPPFFGGLSRNKILVFTLFPKRGELIFGRARHSVRWHSLRKCASGQLQANWKQKKVVITQKGWQRLAGCRPTGNSQRLQSPGKGDSILYHILFQPNYFVLYRKAYTSEYDASASEIVGRERNGNGVVTSVGWNPR